MNLLDQIDARQKGETIDLNRDVFEKCSLSLLSGIYPNLVTISGGSDDGRDAEIADPGGRIGVLVTSARDLDDSSRTCGLGAGRWSRRTSRSIGSSSPTSRS